MEATKIDPKEGTTPLVRSSKQVKVIIILFLSVIVFIAIIILWLKSGLDDNNPSKERNSAKTEISTPNTHNEYYTLKKGEVVRVNIPSGYRCNYYGGGKKYYQQSQNSSKEVWGGGSCPTLKGNPNAAYTDLSYYDEEVTVRCEFIKL